MPKINHSGSDPRGLNQKWLFNWTTFLSCSDQYSCCRSSLWSWWSQTQRHRQTPRHRQSDRHIYTRTLEHWCNKPLTRASKMAHQGKGTCYKAQWLIQTGNPRDRRNLTLASYLLTSTHKPRHAYVNSHTHMHTSKWKIFFFFAKSHYRSIAILQLAMWTRLTSVS